MVFDFAVSGKTADANVARMMLRHSRSTKRRSRDS